MEEENEQIVIATCAKLLEHFDSVRIFVTKHSGSSDQTMAFSTGGGSFYAQLDQINEWKGTQDQVARERAKEE